MQHPIKAEPPIKIAVVGDVHEQWEAADNEAIAHLGVDLVLFVGDFGNESVSVVQQVAALETPKAVILGNHDAVYTATPWGRKKCPYNPQLENRLQAQLDLLGATHVGYEKLDFADFRLSVVGGRPFSYGGPSWKYADFYRDWFGVLNMQESTARIVAAARLSAYDTVIFLSHNGPTGLGDRPEDICGKDWKPIGGDYGDPDLEAAIAQTRQLGKTIPLVTFGHMHHKLKHTQETLRQCVEVSPEGTVYYNGAIVPRIVQIRGEKQRNFSLITLNQGIVSDICIVWVNHQSQIISEEIIYRRKIDAIAQSA
ncbi:MULTISPECIES: TIGR04168 family protein [Planktothricoides]|uniref:TIGR04168 family protein n=2 Tax=Planktothricoides raciborskii TaxID=132608 RepID=A0AAU8JJF7_9CYAN|nr:MULTISPECIES: TIGR04168 family protein [Planktothricoides]KOR37229.1 metallophosphoesterase [Planktothricoides sp. SR001]MBD2545724.1 TIGR04168 family protein [Planktothricoides raciborskii FACHB-1370]MBD2582704.1 TIGR04168 family protein [Planktothricoides raciborskii FACHB-1261]